VVIYGVVISDLPPEENVEEETKNLAAFTNLGHGLLEA
jgi:hypothetical protein